MNKVSEFLSDAGVFYLAVNENGAPHICPMGYVAELDGKPAFAAESGKALYNLLAADPRVEICACNKKLEWVRFSGKAVFPGTDAAKAAAAEAAKVLAPMYDAGKSFEVFILEDAHAVQCDMKGGSCELDV